MSANLISLCAIDKSYYRSKIKIEVFEKIDLEMERAGFYAIMGPSGSGKTTLLNILGGVDRIDAGEFWFDGERIDHLKENELSRWRSHNVAFVFQSFNLLGVLTAAQNVELPLYLTGLSSRERKARVSSALSLVELGDRAKHLPSELSGGQQQRVAIARAIVADTQVILCDEPTGNLDREASNEVLDILSLLNTDFGKTIIMVTHDQIAADYAKVIYHLDKGTFLRQPDHKLTA